MFKYNCFIRKNNKFLQDTLQKIGYLKIKDANNDILFVTHDGHGMSYFDSCNEENIKHLGKFFVDCGTSETLFLGVAAITDEHDQYQFFSTLTDQQWVNQGMYCPKGSWYLCFVKDRYLGKDPQFDNSTVPMKKSTVEELKEFFSDTEEDKLYKEFFDKNS